MAEAAADAAADVASDKHFLESEWVLWEHRAPDKNKSYEDNMAKLCEARPALPLRRQLSLLLDQLPRAHTCRQLGLLMHQVLPPLCRLIFAGGRTDFDNLGTTPSWR